MRQGLLCLYHIGLRRSVLVLQYDFNSDMVVYWDQVSRSWQKDKLDNFQPT